MLPFLTLKTNFRGTSYQKIINRCFFFAFLCLFLLVFCSEDIDILAASDSSANTSDQEASAINPSAVIVSEHDLSISFLYGFDKSSKYGRQMNLRAKITNQGNNFNGTIGILCANDSNGETLYEVPCVIAAGETKKIELTAPISSSNWPSLLVKDEKEQVIIQEYFRVTMTTEPTVVFLGVLTDNTDDFSYISSLGLAKLFFLDETVLPSTADGLDSLDVLMISDFNTDRLSKEQINAILQWTRQGGMLVFGTGSTAAKTLSAFQESVFNGTIGNVEKRTTLLDMSEEELSALKSTLSVSINQPLDYDETTTLLEGSDNPEETTEKASVNVQVDTEETRDSLFTDRISQKEIDALTLEAMPKDMISLELEDFFPILSEKDGFDLIVKNNYGNGTILAAAFELGMKAKYRNSMGTQLYHIIENNFSKTKQLQLSDHNNYNFYSLSRALNVNENNTYPHLKLYFIILVAYAIISGPVLYFILKKLDKRHLLWVMMPCLCLICTIIVYAVGSSTRVTEPFIHYLSFLTLDQTEESVKTDYTQNVYFNVTAPYNKKYSIPLTNISNAEVCGRDYYSGISYSYNINKPASSSYYKTAIYKDGSEHTSLIMNDYAAFDTASFHCISTEEDTKFSGNLEADLTLKEDFTIAGTLTNHLGVDLYQAIYINNGQIYILGSMKNNDSVSLDDCEVSIFNMPQNIENSYTSSGIETMRAIAGCDGWDFSGTALQRQLYFAYVYYLESDSSLFTKGGRFIAVTENGIVNFLEDTGLSAKGLQILDIHIPLSDSIEILDDSFVSVLEGNADLLYYRYLDEMATVQYHISDPETVASLVYQKSGNAEFYSYSTPDFNGTIFAYNILTGEYDELFQSGIVGSCDDLSPYLTADGRLIIRYQRDLALSYSENTVPLLYLVRNS